MIIDYQAKRPSFRPRLIVLAVVAQSSYWVCCTALSAFRIFMLKEFQPFIGDIGTFLFDVFIPIPVSGLLVSLTILGYERARIGMKRGEVVGARNYYRVVMAAIFTSMLLGIVITPSAYANGTFANNVGMWLVAILTLLLSPVACLFIMDLADAYHR